jgi:arylsulfatase A-like enzyme
MNQRFYASLLLVTFAGLPCSDCLFAGEKPNVLFIAIDDMNDWTGLLGGHPQAITPNMDRLADRGVNFRNAHAPAPGCSPSRNAVLFGIQPFNSGLYLFYRNEQIAPAILAKYTTLPQLFKENGYNTYASGKIHHLPEWTYVENGGAREWSENNYETIHSLPPLKYDREAGYAPDDSSKMAFCPTASPLEHHPDYATARFGIDVLGKEHDKPFFLALGFKKPHLPFVAPEKYFDLYAGHIEAPAIKEDDLSDIPWAGRSNARLKDEFRFRSDGAWEQVHRAYLASISWTDANVGRVLDALEASPWAENTIVVLWSDHGYHQGEKRSFRKYSLWEEATRVPFIIWDTRKHAERGRTSKEPASLIDIYPTLTEMTGLKKPAYVDGISLVPWLNDPDLPRGEPAYTTWGRGNYSVRTRNWRYTRYFDGSEELYNHAKDGQEWENLASSPKHEKQKNMLSAWLPVKAAPLVLSGVIRHNVVDADQPSLEKASNLYNKINAKIQPPLE